MTDTLTLIRPDDWHIHFRDGAAMRSVLARLSTCTAAPADVSEWRNPVPLGV